MSDAYRSESDALDARILQIIDAWHRTGEALSEDSFEHLALDLLAYQLRYNEPYARYCAAFGVTAQALPTSWRNIPAVPTAAYKEAALATFAPEHAALTFETSGTTVGVGGRHAMERAELYDAALLAGFDRFMLPDGARLRYFNLVPNPADRPQSSLGYMMARVAALRGDGHTGWYARGDELFYDAFARDLDAAIANGVAVCIAGTAFAFVNLGDELRARGKRFALPNGSRIMETGGFKGRSRVVDRGELYDEIADDFGIARDRIVAEYGMTELTSQWYDVVLRLRAARSAQDDKAIGCGDAIALSLRAEGGVADRNLSLRCKQGPPWLRARLVDAAGRGVPDGVVGALVHVDLANRSSCIAIQTEDLGAMTADGLVLIGRERGAALRGCSLDAEALRAR